MNKASLIKVQQVESVILLLHCTVQPLQPLICIALRLYTTKYYKSLFTKMATVQRPKIDKTKEKKTTVMRRHVLPHSIQSYNNSYKPAFQNV